ncbi:MFS transporter, UMF1 family [Methylomarinovum caldicuralii]|uniref:MFS transporter, UMF1 family n=1 Tax=Methylomarinovum caldicuralii TaxID=438856 RepID=A0AAU9BZF3_9GAMM|nr:MFS transporter [Methylomarinovum caldicuralii]BCX81452.1 MFS transporter, UMF1 family [Methylomarinovum caldicuralii]
MQPKTAWILYDFANSAFATTVMAGFFPLFFKQYWHGGDPVDSTFQLGLANAAASGLILVTAPLLGAVADQGRLHKRLLVGFALLGICATFALALLQAGMAPHALLCFGLGLVGFSGANVFYDSLLVEVAKPAEYERISSLGFALGYLGGGLLFALNVAMALKPQWFGLASSEQALRLAFASVAVWWLVFTLPLLWKVGEKPSRRLSLSLVGDAWRQVVRTLGHVRAHRPAFLFLVAYWFYIDGVDTIVRMAVDYGLAIGLGWKGLIAALLLVQFVGFPAAIAYGRLGEWIGAKRAILLGLAVYVAVTAFAAKLDSATEFYALAVLIGLVQGGVQALSRAYYAHLIPRHMAAEFFGFYNMLGKFAAVLGPLLVGVTGRLAGDPRAGIFSIVALFLIGGAVLLRVRPQVVAS